MYTFGTMALLGLAVLVVAACTGRRSVVVDNGSRYPMDTEAIP
jgi:hypothetical protein